MRENLGTILVSICYSPDSKKLGVIILRAKDLNRGNGKDTGEPRGNSWEFFLLMDHIMNSGFLN